MRPGRIRFRSWVGVRLRIVRLGTRSDVILGRLRLALFHRSGRSDGNRQFCSRGIGLVRPIRTSAHRGGILSAERLPVDEGGAVQHDKPRLDRLAKTNVVGNQPLINVLSSQAFNGPEDVQNLSLAGLIAGPNRCFEAPVDSEEHAAGAR